MNLSHSSADSVRRPVRGRLLRRLLTLLSLGVLVSAWGAHAAFADGVQLTLSTTAAAVGTDVTMTATVTSSLGTPTGTIQFTNVTTGTTLDPSGGETLTVVDANTTTTTFHTPSLAIGTYTIEADYTPDFSAGFTGHIQPMSSSTQVLTVSANPPPPPTYPTQVTLGAPSSVTSTAPVTLTANVTRTSGPAGTPTGTVDFVDLESGTSVPLGSSALSGGIATLDLPSLSAGAHRIQAIYDGDTSDAGSSSLVAAVSSTPPVDSRLHTDSVVTVSPSQIAQGDTVTIVATITQVVPAGGQAPQPPGGSVIFYTDSDACGNNIHLAEVALGDGPPGVVVGPNQAALQTTTLAPCNYTVHGSYTGDVYDRSSDGSAPLVVLPPRTSTAVEYTGDTTVEYGHSATLSATVTDAGGAPLSGRSVTFTIGSQQCSGTTDPSGSASCSLAVTEDVPGTDVTATVARDVQTEGASIDTPFAVTQQPTTLTTGVTLGGAETTLTGTLAGDLGPLAGQTITLSLAGETCTATTGSDGSGSCAVATPAGTAATLSGSFAGTVDYGASAAEDRTVALLKPTTISYTGAASADYSDAALLGANVTGPNGEAVPDGETVTFTLGTQTCTGTTLAGNAFCLLTIAQPAGAYAVTVSYGGDATYAASTRTAPFAVQHEQAVVTVTTGPVLAGSTATLSATLREDGVQPIAGRTVTLTLGSQSCSGTTGSSGVATCTVPAPTTAGLASATASFAGDDYYVPGNDATQAIVYAYAPGGGSFVVGDRSLAGTVTFWGAQWWKDNSLSGGSAPAAFKGFALHGSTQCGTDWSTDPGNSSPPPAGPLPAYMAVIVASSATKSGSTISGDTASVVVVRTNAGYAPNPGHAGTGTVVATVCGGASNDSHSGGELGDWNAGHGSWGDDRRSRHGSDR